MNIDAAEQLSYAMRNTEARAHFLSFNAPHELLDWSFPVIEAIMITGALLALLHAWRHSKTQHTPSALYTFVGIFLFGLVMDIASYYTLVSFWHGEFSVMLVWNRLPLYIAMLYPALLYHSYMTIRRYDFAPLTEAICTAFYCGTLYLIFDNLGPALNWWTWNREVIYNQPFLNSVPLTSYHWMFLFSGALAYCLRKFAWDAVAKGNLYKARIGVACMPLLTIGLGCVLFIPYDVFLFVVKDTIYIAALIHALGFFAAGYWFLVQYRQPAQPRDNLLMFFPIVWLVGLLYLYIARFDMLWAVTPEGMNAQGLAVGNLLAVFVAIIIGAVITLLSHPTETSVTFSSHPARRSMHADNTRILIARYYAAFNTGNMQEFLELLSEDVLHDINQGERQSGKAAFSTFMQRMNYNYKEQLVNIVIMASSDGTRAAAEFIVHGTYLNSDEGLPPAKGQTYVLPAGAFFEIRNNKIARISNYYNLGDWIRQVEG